MTKQVAKKPSYFIFVWLFFQTWQQCPLIAAQHWDLLEFLLMGNTLLTVKLHLNNVDNGVCLMAIFWKVFYKLFYNCFAINWIQFFYISDRIFLDTVCPQDWELYDDVCLQINKTLMTFETAQASGCAQGYFYTQTLLRRTFIKTCLFCIL